MAAKPYARTLDEKYNPQPYARTFLAGQDLPENVALTVKVVVDRVSSDGKWVRFYLGRKRIWDCNYHFFKEWFTKVAVILLMLASSAHAEFSNCRVTSSGLFQDTLYVCQQETKLVALKDRTSKVGSWGVFLLVGGGDLRENWIVRFAKEDEQGFTHLYEIPYSQVRIKEGDWKEPIVKKWVMVQNGQLYSENIPGFADEDRGYFFFVPKGTIENQYKVDLQ